MPRLQSAANGAIVSVSDEVAAALGSEWEPIGDTAAEPTGYADLKVADLKVEIARRNEGRSEEDLISEDGKKADLVASLEADDAALAEGSGDSPGDE